MVIALRSVCTTVKHNKTCDPNGQKSMAVWEWSGMHISEHVSVLRFASITFPIFFCKVYNNEFF
jgi:hypothetical protein